MINNEPKVVIVILNWNNYKDTIECLESVMKLQYSNYKVILLDNGSTDGSINKIKDWGEKNFNNRDLMLIKDLAKFSSKDIIKGDERYLGAKLIIFRSRKNLGFAEGNNRCIEFVLNRLDSTKYIFLLNNDTLLESDSLRNAMEAMKKKKADIIGFLVKDIHGKIIFAKDSRPLEFFYIRNDISKTGLNKCESCSMVQGCAMLIRKETIETHKKIKGYFFNKKLFLYGEETEFCLSIKQNLGRIYVDRDAVVYHKISQSFKSEKKEAIKIYYTTRNTMFIANSVLKGFWLVFFHFYYPLIRIKVIIQKVILNKFLEARSILFGLYDGYRGKGGKWEKAEKIT